VYCCEQTTVRTMDLVDIRQEALFALIRFAEFSKTPCGGAGVCQYRLVCASELRQQHKGDRRLSLICCGCLIASVGGIIADNNLYV